MSKGLLFWIIFILSALFGCYWGYASWGWGGLGGGLIAFILFGLLGWATFGPPIKG